MCSDYLPCCVVPANAQQISCWIAVVRAKQHPGGPRGAGPAPMVGTRVTGRVTVFGPCWGNGRCSCLRGSPGVVNVQKNCS